MSTRDALFAAAIVLPSITVGHGTWFALIGWLLVFALVMQFVLLTAIGWLMPTPKDFVDDPENDDGRGEKP